MEVARVMVARDSLVTSKKGQTVLHAMQSMVESNVGSIIIVDDPDEAIGIVTADDLMRAVIQDPEDGLSKSLGEIMSGDLHTVGVSEQLNLAIQKLEEAKTHHLVVVDQAGRLAGVLSSFDVVRERALDIKSHPWIRK